MADQQPVDRFKPEMPAIPGVAGGAQRRNAGNPAIRMVGALLAVLLVVFLGARFFLRPKHVDPPPPEPPPQIEVPAPAVDPSAGIPRATETKPEIATLVEMDKPWSSKEFFFKNPLTGENVPALLIRLPNTAANQPKGYWALQMKAAYGDCKLEYVTDIAKLKTDYDFRAARHPMVGNPCSRTLFDPTRITNLPGNIWVQGAIAQGSDLRPPLGIEIQVKGQDILAVRME
ncbi:MAG TPA: hypothetical protein VJP87_02515 [Candidatus Acidoferrales bacterium]|nr:hypothetical protein [Candidatus Acidoferrales bacterium]